MKKLNLLIFLILGNPLSFNLYAQASPFYNSILDQKNKFSLKKALKISFPLTAISGIGIFMNTQIHALENIPMMNLGAEVLEENPVDEWEEEFLQEKELIREMYEGFKISISIGGAGLMLLMTPYLIKSLYNNFKSSSNFEKPLLFNYNYFIKNINGEEICSGSKSFHSVKKELLISELSLEELNVNCNNELEKGKNYFIKLEDLDGNLLLKWKKIIFLSR